MKRTSAVCLAASLAMTLFACSGSSAISIEVATDSGSAPTAAGDEDSAVAIPNEPVSNGKSDTPVEDAAAVSRGDADGATIVDASRNADGSASADGSAIGHDSVNGCDASDFAMNDQSDPLATRAINVGGGGGGGHGNGVRPVCMRIKLAEAVTFQGAFGIAPLEPSGGTTPSPIVETKIGKTVTFTFAAVGTFGFKTVAGKESVAGAIDVMP